MTMTEELLTVETVAERLQVHPETVRRWIRAGQLNAIRLGERAGFRVRESELERFLQAREGKR